MDYEILGYTVEFTCITYGCSAHGSKECRSEEEAVEFCKALPEEFTFRIVKKSVAIWED